MAWGGNRLDALGLDAFSAWGNDNEDRHPSNVVRASYQPSPALRRPAPTPVARRAMPTDYENELDDNFTRYEGGSPAHGAVNRQRGSPSHGARGTGRPAQASNTGTRELVRKACATLGRTDAEADVWADRLEAEWLENVSQLRELSDDDWARLEVPSGLRTELRRCLARGRAAQPQRPGSAPPGQRPRPSSIPPGGGGRGVASRMVARAAGGTLVQRQRGSELDPLRRSLRQQVGPSWSVALLRALRGRKEIDVDFLQGALRSLGVAGVSVSQLRAAVRAAAPDGGSPNAESIIGVLHGPLQGWREQAVRGVFDSLDVGGEGVVPVSVLRRRCVAVEHPSVKAGRLSASEALQAVLRHWRQTPEVTAEDFLAGHGSLSGLWTGDDEGFARLVCRLWGVPLNSAIAANSGVKQQPGTYPMSQDKALAADRQWLDDGVVGRRVNQGQPRQQGVAGKPAKFGANVRPPPPVYDQAFADNSLQRGHQQTVNFATEPPMAYNQAPSADDEWADVPWIPLGRQRDRDFLNEVPLNPPLQDEFYEAAASGHWPGEAQQQRDRVQIPLTPSPQAKALLERLRYALQRLGCHVWLDLSQRLRIAGKGQGGCVTPLELGAAIRQIGIGMPHDDAVELTRAADVDGTGCANIEKLLGFLAVPLSSQRAAVVRDVFRRLDEDKDGLLSIQQLLDRFVPGRHPDVEAGRKNGREALLEVQAALNDFGNGGRLSAPGFIRYYEGVSAGMSSDQYFSHIVQSVWGLDSGPDGLRARNARRQQGSIRNFESGMG